MNKRKRASGEVVLLLILALAFGSGFLIAKKDDQRLAADLPAGQTTQTWTPITPVSLVGEQPTPNVEKVITK